MKTNKTNKTSMKKGMLLILLLVPLLATTSYAVDWWNTDYASRTTFNIIHTSNVTDYSMLVELPYLTGTQNDYDDVRFLWNENNTELPYYLQWSNSTTSLWWFKANVTTVNKTIYVYYGNSTVSSNSDWNNAFYISDDFNDNNISTTIWNENEFNGVITETGGKLNMSCDVNVNNSCSTQYDGVGNRTAPVLWTILDEAYDYEIYVEITKDNWLGSGGFGRRESNGFWVSNGGINNSMFNWNGTNFLPTWYNVSAVYQAFFSYYNKTYIFNNDNTEPFNGIGGGEQNSTSCLVMRIFGGGNVTAYSGNSTSDCQNNVNFSPIVLGDKINYYYDNAWNETGLYLEGDYTGGDVIGQVSVAFDNFRVRKLDSNIDSVETYLSDEPQITLIGVIEILPTTIEMTIYSPTNTTYQSANPTASVNVQISVNDTLDTAWYEYDSNGTNVSYAPNTTITVNVGQHNLTLWVNDTHGSEDTITIYFTYEQVTPPAPTGMFGFNVTEGAEELVNVIIVLIPLIFVFIMVGLYKGWFTKLGGLFKK